MSVKKNGSMLSRWISIRDDIPSPGTAVLVCVDGEVKRDVYSYGMWEHTWESVSSGDWLRVQLDHFWMRLPEGTNDIASNKFNQCQFSTVRTGLPA